MKKDDLLRIAQDLGLNVNSKTLKRTIVKLLGEAEKAHRSV
jgi:hypothetical protein